MSLALVLSKDVPAVHMNDSADAPEGSENVEDVAFCEQRSQNLGTAGSYWAVASRDLKKGEKLSWANFRKSILVK